MSPTFVVPATLRTADLCNPAPSSRELRYARCESDSSGPRGALSPAGGVLTWSTTTSCPICSASSRLDMTIPELERRIVPGDLGTRAAAFDLLAAGAAVLDGAGVIVDTNESWRLFTHLNDGDRAATGVGVDYLAVCDRASAAGDWGAAEVAEGLRHVLAGERVRMDFEYPCPSPTEDRWFLMQAKAAPIAGGTGAVVLHVDITSRKLLSDRLASLANDDELTGLPNRRSAVEYLEQQLGQARLAGGSVCVLFIDLNRFKDINDRHGNHVGDELLCKVAVRARRALRAKDRLCRFGGDEFVLICPGLARVGAAGLAGRLRELMDDTVPDRRHRSAVWGVSRVRRERAGFDLRLVGHVRRSGRCTSTSVGTRHCLTQPSGSER